MKELIEILYLFAVLGSSLMFGLVAKDIYEIEGRSWGCIFMTILCIMNLFLGAATIFYII